MKKTTFILAVLLIAFAACKKPINCGTSTVNDGQSVTTSQETGESVMLPITFQGFYPFDINNMRVFKTNNVTMKRDTFALNKILWAFSVHGNKEHITDRALDGNTDPYYSYFNNSTLIFDWTLKRDTLSNFVIKKSKGGTTDKCHKDDPIVILDSVYYYHKGIKISMKDSGILIIK